MSIHQSFTKNKYALLEVISALQKEIRRGNEYEAMYWALELVPEFEQYLWRRLVVIANEDIGIANIPLLTLVPQQRALFFEFRSQRGGNGNARLILANTILALCRSEKSRLADHFQCVVEQARRHEERIEIPDYALDKHTGRGRAQKRGFDHWLKEGCKLAPLGDVSDLYAERAAQYWRSDFIAGDQWGERSKTTRDERNMLTELTDDQLALF